MKLSADIILVNLKLLSSIVTDLKNQTLTPTSFGSTVVQSNELLKPTKTSQKDSLYQDGMIPKPTFYKWFLTG